MIVTDQQNEKAQKMCNKLKLIAALNLATNSGFGTGGFISADFIIGQVLDRVLQKIPNEWQSDYERKMEFFQEGFVYKSVHPIDWLYKEFTKFENSEYAGKSKSGQSAGIDLMKDRNSTSIWEIWDKVNEVINQLNKPSETTKEQPKKCVFHDKLYNKSTVCTCNGNFCTQTGAQIDSIHA